MTEQKPKRYVGVTGITTQEQALAICNSAPADVSGLVMIGVLASEKTSFLGQVNKWPKRYPLTQNISGIFPNHHRALNLIHYNTKDASTLLRQLIRMTEIAGPNFHGFQLNMAWPSTGVLSSYRSFYPNETIVLQIGKNAFERVQHVPSRLATRICHYAGLVDYVLLDTSGGLGKEFNREEMRNYLLELKALNLPIGLGTAGGLSSQTLGNIAPLVGEFKDLSMDAEGKLRDEKDNLILQEACQYERDGFELYREVG